MLGEFANPPVTRPLKASSTAKVAPRANTFRARPGAARPNARGSNHDMADLLVLREKSGYELVRALCRDLSMSGPGSCPYAPLETNLCASRAACQAPLLACRPTDLSAQS